MANALYVAGLCSWCQYLVLFLHRQKNQKGGTKPIAPQVTRCAHEKVCKADTPGLININQL
jgi:hypothetical protein